MRSSLRALLATCILAVSAAGCGARSECNAVFDAVEAPLAEVRAALPAVDDQASPPPTPEKLRAVAAAYAKLAAAVEKVSVKDADIGARVASYRGYVAEIAEGFEMLAAAVEAEDEAKLKAARQKLDLASNNEQVVWGNIDRLCGH